MERLRILRSPVGALILALVICFGAAVGVSSHEISAAIDEQSGRLVSFLVLCLLLQLFAVRMPARGSMSVSAVGLCAAGFLLGVGPAMALAAAVAVAQWIKSRGLLHRAIFDVANFALSAGAATLAYELLTNLSSSGVTRAAAAVAAGVVYSVVNTGLLCLAMSLSEQTDLLAVWQSRFRWLSPHYLAFGPFALAGAIAYEHVGLAGLFALLLPYSAVLIGHRNALAVR